MQSWKFCFRIDGHGIDSINNTCKTLKCWSRVYIQEPNFVVTVITDALTHNVTKPSTGIVIMQNTSNVNVDGLMQKTHWSYTSFALSHDIYHLLPQYLCGGGWGCEVSCGGHHRPRGKTSTGSALDGAVFDIAQILAYLVHNMSRSQLYLGFGHFGWLPSFFGQYHFGGLMVKLYFLCWNYSLSSGWHIIAA